MAKKKKANKKALKKRQQNGVASEHVLDRLYAVIDSRKGADPGHLLHRPSVQPRPPADRQEARRRGGRGADRRASRRQAKLVGESATCSITC
jgi:hypothetical protein